MDCGLLVAILPVYAEGPIPKEIFIHLPVRHSRPDLFRGRVVLTKSPSDKLFVPILGGFRGAPVKKSNGDHCVVFVLCCGVHGALPEARSCSIIYNKSATPVVFGKA